MLGFVSLNMAGLQHLSIVFIENVRCDYATHIVTSSHVWLGSNIEDSAGAKHWKLHFCLSMR